MNEEILFKLRIDNDEAIKCLEDTYGSLKKITVGMTETNSKTKEAVAAISYFDMANKQAKTGLLDLVKSQSLFGVSVGDVLDKFQSGTKNTGAFVKSLGGIKGALSAIVAIPIVLFLTSLVTLLTKTQKGQEFLSKSTAAFGAVVDAMISKFSGFAQTVLDAFNNPKKALSDFTGLLSELANKTLSNLISGFKGLGTSVSLLFRGQFSESAKVAGESLLKLNPASAVLEKIAGTAIETGKELFNAGKQAFELEGAMIALGKQTQNNEKLLAKLNSQYELQNSIADDSTRSFAQRQAASEKAREVAEKIAKIQLDQARAELGISNAQLAQKQKLGLVDTELREKQLASSLKLIEAENNYQKTIFENNKQRSELRQAEAEKNLDILLDGLDSQKTLNEKAIADETLTLEKRKEILDETRKLAEDSFQSQIDTIQAFTKQQINADDLLAETDARRLNEKIRNLDLSETLEGRLLEVLRERRTVVSDLADDEKTLEESRIKAQEREAELIRKNLENQKTGIEARLLLAKEGSDAEFELKKEALQKQSELELAASNISAEKRLYIENQLAKNLKDLDAERLENRKKKEQDTQEAVLNIISEGTEVLSSIFELQKQSELEAAGKNTKKKEEIERKYAKKEQGLAITRTIISGGEAFVKALTAGPVIGEILAGLVAAQTALQIALISSQKFAAGGYTGPGSGLPDETGFRPVGIVHENEYVVPEKVLNSSQGQYHVNELEKMRNRGQLRGFADGGFTTQKIYNQASNSQSVTQVTNYSNVSQLIKEQPLQVSVTEINKVQKKVNVIENKSKF
jgi:hypothetical protein